MTEDTGLEVPSCDITYSQMVPEHKKTWLEALRGNKYKQGRGHLRKSNGQDVFCCLGVLQDCIMPESWISPDEYDHGDNKLWGVVEGFEGEYSEPSISDGEIQDILMDETNFDSEAMHVLITMNDGRYQSGAIGSKPEDKIDLRDFNYIADWIEANL